MKTEGCQWVSLRDMKGAGRVRLTGVDECEGRRYPILEREACGSGRTEGCILSMERAGKAQGVTKRRRWECWSGEANAFVELKRGRRASGRRWAGRQVVPHLRGCGGAGRCRGPGELAMPRLSPLLPLPPRYGDDNRQRKTPRHSRPKKPALSGGCFQMGAGARKGPRRPGKKTGANQVRRSRSRSLGREVLLPVCRRMLWRLRVARCNCPAGAPGGACGLCCWMRGRVGQAGNGRCFGIDRGFQSRLV